MLGMGVLLKEIMMADFLLETEEEDSPEGFLHDLHELWESEDSNIVLDALYDVIDYLLRCDMFQRVDDILDSIDVKEEPEDILLTFLTGTLPARSKLNRRADFFNRVKQLYEELGEPDIDGLLGGLE